MKKLISMFTTVLLIVALNINCYAELNPIEEAKFAALEKNCHDLGVPAPPSIHINFEVKDKDGNLIFNDKQRGHSWTRNFYNYLFCTAGDSVGNPGSTSFGASHLTSKNTGGTVRYTETYVPNRDEYNTDSFGFRGPVGNSGYGILVGTGDTAFSAENFAMAAAVVHGTSTGNLTYSAQGVPVVAYDSTSGSEKWTITHTRVLNNNSGGAITIKETGLAWLGDFFNTTAAAYLFERSVLSPTVAVPNGAQLTVTYEISMSFAAID